MELPQELAVDRPLKLGATFNGNTTDGFLTYRYDFQPDSMQRVSQGDLLFLGTAQEEMKFIPELPEGDAPFHYAGPCTTLQQQDGEDTECLAFFNGTDWILELVSARITAKHVRGTPHVRGYNIDYDEAAASLHSPLVPQHAAAATHCAADDDIDQDLNDALDEALFAASTAADEHTGQHQLQLAAESPVVHQHQQEQQPLHQAMQQQLSTGPAGQHKQELQQQAEAVQQQHIQHQDHSEQDPDDPWAEYDTASPAPATMQAATPPPLQHPAAAGVQPTAAAGVQHPAAAAVQHPAAAVVQPTAAAAVQPTAAAGTGGVCVVTSHEEGQSDDEDQDEDAVHACSDDDSDGLGVEVF